MDARNYGRSLAALTASGISRRESAKALLAARRHGLWTVAGRNSGWTIVRQGQLFAMTQESFVLANTVVERHHCGCVIVITDGELDSRTIACERHVVFTSEYGHVQMRPTGVAAQPTDDAALKSLRDALCGS